MAKKSNKTEHVLKLITKNEDAMEDDFFGINPISNHLEPSEASPKTAAAPKPKKNTAVKNEAAPETKPAEIKSAEPKTIESTEEKPPTIEAEAQPSEEKSQPVVPKAQLDEDKSQPVEKKDQLADRKSQSTEEKTERAEMKGAEAAEPLKMEEAAPQNAGSALFAQHDNLVNIAEVLAKEKLTLVMSRMKVCSCSTCVNDVLALALNSLPTKYVTTDAGKQYFQLDMYKKQYETDVLAALTKACVRVKASPRH